MGVVTTCLAIAGGTYLYFLIFTWLCADRVIYQPKPPSYGRHEVELSLTANDGTQICAMHLRGDEDAPTILFLHGNNEDLGQIRNHLEAMRERGFSVLSFDYRGYGQTPGRPTESNLYADTATVYKYLTRDLGVKPTSVLVYGRSLGSGPAVELAVNKEVGALILEGAFISAFRSATQVPILPLDRYKNLQKIRRVRAPVLVIHAVKDRVIPFHHGRQLFAAANEPKEHLWMEGISHAAFIDSPGVEYWLALDRFARSVKGAS